MVDLAYELLTIIIRFIDRRSKGREIRRGLLRIIKEMKLGNHDIVDKIMGRCYPKWNDSDEIMKSNRSTSC